MRTILFFICALTLNCATGLKASKVTVIDYDPKNSTEYFIVSEEAMLTIGYIMQVDRQKDTFDEDNYSIKLFDGGLICDVDGPRSRSTCFNFPHAEKTEIIVSEKGNVLLRNEVSPGCYAIYKAKHISDIQMGENNISWQLYSGLLRKPYLITTEGCSSKPTIKT